MHKIIHFLKSVKKMKKRTYFITKSYNFRVRKNYIRVSVMVSVSVRS